MLDDRDGGAGGFGGRETGVGVVVDELELEIGDEIEQFEQGEVSDGVGVGEAANGQMDDGEGARVKLDQKAVNAADWAKIDIFVAERLDDAFNVVADGDSSAEPVVKLSVEQQSATARFKVGTALITGDFVDKTERTVGLRTKSVGGGQSFVGRITVHRDTSKLIRYGICFYYSIFLRFWQEGA